MSPAPLSHIRVLEFGGYIASPYATALLSSLGADVVKVERPGSGDEFRRGLNNLGAFWVQYNAGKRSIAVDLKTPEGIDLVRSLVPHFDVVVENLRPGKMAAMGLGPDDLSALKQDLVYASVTGFGAGGPLSNRAAFDTIGQAFGGLNTIFNEDGNPQLLGTCIADLVTGLSTVGGICAALLARDATGQPQRLETSMLEAVSTLTIDAVTQYYVDGHRDPSRQSRHPQAQNFVLKTAGGESVALHLSSPQKFWLNLLAAIDRPELADDPRFLTFQDRQDNYFDLVKVLEVEFLARPLQFWEEALTANDVPFAPALTVSGFLDHPQTQWLQLVEPERDGTALVRVPWRFDGTRPPRGQSAPRIGADTRSVAAEVLDESSVQTLLTSGVLFADE